MTARSLIDHVCPPEVGEALLVLSLADASAPRVAHRAIDIAVSYAKTLPSSVVLPLELLIDGPTAGSFQRRFYRRIAPASVTFIPREGGLHNITIKEVFHNRWWGALQIEVAGETLEP